jgi:hypothetical protein
MARGDLDRSLLLKIMTRLGHLREEYTKNHNSFELLDLLPADIKVNQQTAFAYLKPYLKFLEECGYIRIGGSLLHFGICTLDLTASGQMFVQPDLAEFGKEPLLPAVVRSIEDRIQVLTYPSQEEKSGMLFSLREAVAKQTPDVIAKVLAEIGYKLLRGGS